MSKLLSQQLKENIKDISLWMIIPMILALVLNKINIYFNSSILSLIIVLSTLVMYSSFAIAMVIVILNDYKRFYGEGAAFYDVLPVKDKDITLSRFLNYVIMALLAGIILIIELLVFFLVATHIGFEGLNEIFETIKNVLRQIPNTSIFFTSLAVITSLIVNLVRFIASITIGSDRVFKNLGKFGPIIVFIIISIISSIIGLILARFLIGSLESLNTAQTVAQTAAESGQFTVQVAERVKDVTKIMAFGSGLNILSILVLMFLTNYFHKNRLSVA